MSVNNFPFIRLSSTKLIFSSFSYSSMQVVSTTSSTVHHRTPKNPKPLRESLQNGTPRASILYRHLRNCDCWRASTGQMLFNNRMAMHCRTQQISWKELGYIANEKLLGKLREQHEHLFELLRCTGIEYCSRTGTIIVPEHWWEVKIKVTSFCTSIAIEHSTPCVTQKLHVCWFSNS